MGIVRSISVPVRRCRASIAWCSRSRSRPKSPSKSRHTVWTWLPSFCEASYSIRNFGALHAVVVLLAALAVAPAQAKRIVVEALARRAPGARRAAAPRSCPRTPRSACAAAPSAPRSARAPRCPRLSSGETRSLLARDDVAVGAGIDDRRALLGRVERMRGACAPRPPRRPARAGPSSGPSAPRPGWRRRSWAWSRPPCRRAR